MIQSGFRIGLFYPNSSSIHLLSSRARELNPDPLSLQAHQELARAAEEAGFDYVFLADAWGGRGPRSTELGLTDPAVFPPILAGVLAAATSRIKIITTLHLLWLHPLHIIRIGANLDALSGGRWGMNAVTGAGFAEGLVRSVSQVSDHDERYAMAAEAMEAVLQGWRDGGRVSFKGRYYEIEGQLVGPAPVQRPHPLVVSAGASEAGRAFAARYATYVFLPGRATRELITERVAQIRAVAAAAGRDPGEIKALTHASVIVRDSQSEAEEVAHELRESVDVEAVHEYLKEIRQITTYDDMLGKFSLDELKDLGLTAGTAVFHGDAETVAGKIGALREDLGTDGVSLSFPIWHPEEIQRFGRLVVPLLEQRGIWSRSTGQW